MRAEQCVRLLKLLTSNASKVSFTADTWSSAIYKGYMVVTGHWTDGNWALKNTILEIRRFIILHNGDATCNFMEQLTPHWNLRCSVSAITTDSGTYMVSGVRKQWTVLRSSNHQVYCTIEMLHVRGISHALNLTMKE